MINNINFLIIGCRSIKSWAAILFFFLSISIQSQSHSLQGLILDGKTREAIYNSIIFVIEDGSTAISNEKGEFALKIKNDSVITIKITHISYQENVINIFPGEYSDKKLVIYLFPKPLELSPVVVTDKSTRSKFDDMYEQTSILKGKELEKNLGFTLASTLKNEVGIAMRSMGPAPSRPVIRGLGGDRVSISEDETTSIDLSSTSPDHAIALEPLTIDRIEVIRGPKILQYSTTTLGGLVNVIRDEIPSALPDQIHGTVSLFSESANKTKVGAIVSQIPIYKYALRLEGSIRDAENVHTPIGELNNTQLDTKNYSVGFSKINNWGYMGFSTREFKSDYGIPGGFIGAHPNGVNIQMLKRQHNFKGEIKLKNNQFKNVEFNFSRAYFNQKEFESNRLLGAEFVIRNWQSFININHDSLWVFNQGLFGIYYQYRDYKIGGYVFNPPVISHKVGLYAVESFSALGLNWETSARIGFDNIIPQYSINRQNDSIFVKKKFNSFSISLASLYEINDEWFVGSNISRSSRVPTIEDLYSLGPHLAAYTFEKGNPHLKLETGFGFEFYSFIKNSNYFVTLNLYYNKFDNYIIPRNTGEINFATLLPIYRTDGVKAAFYGIEFQSEYNFLKNFAINFSTSYTEGKNLDENIWLPAIPPLKSIIELSYKTQLYTFGVIVETAAIQNKLDRFEQMTDGYIIYNFFGQARFTIGALINNISLTVDNLFNNEYRNHLSRVKSIMPEAGLSVRLTNRLFF